MVGVDRPGDRVAWPKRTATARTRIVTETMRMREARRQVMLVEVVPQCPPMIRSSAMAAKRSAR